MQGMVERCEIHDDDGLKWDLRGIALKIYSLFRPSFVAVEGVQTVKMNQLCFVPSLMEGSHA